MGDAGSSSRGSEGGTDEAPLWGGRSPSAGGTVDASPLSSSPPLSSPPLAPPSSAPLPLPPPPPPPPPPSKWRYARLVVTAWLGYAVALFVNGSSKRLLSSLEAAGGAPPAPPSAVDASPHLHALTKLLHQQLAPLYALASYRMLAVGTLLAYLALRGRLRGGDDLSRRLWVPVAIGVTNAGGYLFFNVLCALSGVALWASLIGLYAVLPVGYGLLVRGEGRSRRKLAGVALCLGAVVLLSLSTATGGDADAAAVAAGSPLLDAASAAGRALRAALFAAALLTWAVCDTLGAYVGKGPAPLQEGTIVAGAGLGFGLVAWGSAGLAAAIEAHAGGGGGGGAGVAAAVAAAGLLNATGGGSATAAAAPPPNVGGWWAAQAVLVAGQALGVAAWHAYIQLGALPGSEASSFLPLIATYTLFASVLGIALLGEALSPVGYVGMAVAGVGVWLVSGDDGSRGGGSGGRGGGGAAEGAAAAGAAAVATARGSGDGNSSEGGGGSWHRPPYEGARAPPPTRAKEGLPPSGP